MSKDRRETRRKCASCEKWAEEGSELCADCETDWWEKEEYDDPLDQERADSMVGE